jgi:hypothetical protein
LLSTGMFSLLANRFSQIESARGGDVRALVADLIVILAGVEPAVNQHSTADLLFSQWSQFSEGLSIWSITNTSTGPLAGTSFKPSCS